MKIRARYTGDHDNFRAWGIRFPVGEFVEVTDPRAIDKITGNSHFEVEGVEPKKPADDDNPGGDSKPAGDPKPDTKPATPKKGAGVPKKPADDDK